MSWTWAGWLAALTTAAIGLPQAVRLLRSGTAAGVSLVAWQALWWTAAAWSAYGALTARLPVLLPNVAMFTLAAIVLVLVARHRRLGHGAVFGPPVVGVSFALIARAVLGEAGFAVIMLIPAVGFRTGQILASRRAADVAGVSIATLVLACGTQVLWLAYGIGTGAAAIVSVGVPALALSVGALAVTAGHPSMRRPWVPVP